MFWLFLSLTLIFDLAGMMAGRAAAQRGIPAFFWLCVLLFTLVGLSVAFMMQYRGVTVATIIWAGMAPVLALLFGYLLFDERLTMRQLVGAALIIAGVMLVEWRGQEEPETDPIAQSATK